MFQPTIRKTLIAAALGIVSSSASAVLVTLPGVNFDLTYDDAKLGAYGAPSLLGSFITFTPSTYVAQSNNGNPPTMLDLESSTINLRIALHDGFRIQSVALSEGGDYLKLGSLSQVGVSGQTRALDLAQNVATQVIQPILVSPLNITNPGLPNPSFATHNWNATTFTDLSGASYASTQTLSYTIQNLLFAFSAPFGPSPLDPDLIRQAFIEKKFVGLDVSVTLIPEPEVWAMMLVGAGLVGFQLRRKSKQMLIQRFV